MERNQSNSFRSDTDREYQKDSTTVTIRNSDSSERLLPLAAALGVGGLVAFLLWKGKGGDPVPEPDPIPWGQQGFTGTYYGGPNGLGLILGFQGATTSAELNAQTSVWAIDLKDSNELYLMSELMKMWKVDQPFKYRAEDGKLEVTLLTDEETQKQIERFSVKNKSSIHSDYFNIADVDLTFSPDLGYEDNPNSVEMDILFPIPLNAGKNADRVTDTGISDRSAWYITSAHVRITTIRHKKKWWFINYNSNTNYCRVRVDAPMLGSWSYVTTMKRGEYVVEKLIPLSVHDTVAMWVQAFLSFGFSLIGSSNLEAVTLYNQTQGHNGNIIYKSTTSEKNWRTLNRAVKFWHEEGGLLGLGTSALETLFKGLNAQKYNVVAFSEGNWINGAIDAVDIQTIFSTLLISPQPIVMYTPIDVDYEQLSQFAYCWFASVHNGVAREDGNVSLPNWVTPLVFPALIADIRSLQLGVHVNSTSGDSLSDVIDATADSLYHKKINGDFDPTSLQIVNP